MITRDDIEAAAKRIAPAIVRTPLLRSDALDAACGAKVFVKAECLQRYGAFKMRGATNKIASLSKVERANGVLAFSSGNHAIAVAAVARDHGIGAVIVMPTDAPRMKRATAEGLGAEIVDYDRVREDREAIGARIAAERGLPLVKPYDDPLIAAGQGTIGLEIEEQLDGRADFVFAPCGGGGLSGGVAVAMAGSRVFAVEPVGHEDMARSLSSGERERNEPGVRSICDGLLPDMPGEITFEIAKRHLAGAVSVTNEMVLDAMAFAFKHLKIVVEPSGAAGLAAALNGLVDIKGKTVAVVVSGGNVDAEMFARALDRVG